MKARDSGSRHQTSSSMVRDSPPPTRKIERQPMALTSATDTKPAMMAPTGYPDWSMATANFWRLALLYSDTMVVRLDNMPPTPRPVISRVISNVVTSWANAEVNMPTEMMARPIRIRVRRP